MTAPAGAIVGLYVDLVARVHIGDVIETQTGRRYQVGFVRVQQRGKHRGRQHLQVTVLGPEEITRGISHQTHHIRWYKRPKKRIRSRP